MKDIPILYNFVLKKKLQVNLGIKHYNVLGEKWILRKNHYEICLRGVLLNC